MAALLALLCAVGACSFSVSVGTPRHAEARAEVAPGPAPAPQPNGEPESEPAEPRPPRPKGLVVEKFPTRPKPGKRAALDPASRSMVGAANTKNDLGKMFVHFIDVGQGDTTLIQCPESKNIILFDVGGAMGGAAPPPTFEGDRADAVRDYIENILGGAKRVHALFISHPDRDHYNGLSTVLANVTADRVLLGGKLDDYSGKIPGPEGEEPMENPGAFAWLEKVSKKGKQDEPHVVTLESPTNASKRVQDVDCGKAEIRLLSANLQASVTNKSAVRNALSTVLWIKHGEADFILAGDATEATLSGILGRADESTLDAEVLKVPHHGAKTGHHPDFLGKVKPWISMLSSKVDHKYGHPRKEVVDALEQYAKDANAHALTAYDTAWLPTRQLDKAIFNVGEIGTVTIESDGATLTTRYGSTVEKGLKTKKQPANAAAAGDKGSDERAVAAPAKDKGAGEPTITCARTCKEPYQPCGWTTSKPNARGEWRPQCLRGPVYDRCMTKNHPHPEIWKTCR